MMYSEKIVLVNAHPLIRQKTHVNCISTSICTELQMQTNQFQIEIHAEPYAQLNNVFWDMICDNEWRGNAQ